MQKGLAREEFVQQVFQVSEQALNSPVGKKKKITSKKKIAGFRFLDSQHLALATVIGIAA